MTYGYQVVIYGEPMWKCGALWDSKPTKTSSAPEGDPMGANTDGYLPKPYFAAGSKNIKPQSRYLQDASYLRLKNIQIGYTLPTNLVSKTRSF